jgi:hypothetical protein
MTASWREQAACIGQSDLMFGRGIYREAVALCRDCPVIKPCFDYANTEPILDMGIAGGMGPKARVTRLRRGIWPSEDELRAHADRTLRGRYAMSA